MLSGEYNSQVIHAENMQEGMHLQIMEVIFYGNPNATNTYTDSATFFAIAGVDRIG